MPGGTTQTAAQARIVDPVLTNVARQYKHPQAVGDHLFPEVAVAQRGGKTIEFSRDDFKQFNTARTPGSRTLRVQFGHTGKSYGLTDHAIEGKVPVELQQDAAAVPGIDLGNNAVSGASNIIKLGKEIAQATLATTATNYAANNKVTLSGKSQWSHAESDPTATIADAVSAVRKAIGMRPNTIVMGGAVFDKVKVHAKILERIKYTSRESATPELLAGLWDVSNVWVGDAIYVDDAGTSKDVWGDNVVVAYTPLGTVSMGEPSFGYTYQLNGFPIGEPPYYDHNEKSWLYPTCEAYEPQIVGKDAGYLISDVLS